MCFIVAKTLLSREIYCVVGNAMATGSRHVLDRSRYSPAIEITLAETVMSTTPRLPRASPMSYDSVELLSLNLAVRARVCALRYRDSIEHAKQTAKLYFSLSDTCYKFNNN